MMRQSSLLFIVATLFITFASSSHAQFALGTGFTYQGQLKDGGAPVTGSYDFEFKLFNDPTAGAQQGSTLTVGELAVSGGLFSTVLDFGAQFSGQKRWLEIGVRPGADSDPDPYTLLTPRVELTATPNSLYASNSGALDGKDSLDFLEKDGRAFVIVRTTDNATTNALNLIAAYNQAKALTPHGAALSADNRAVVLVPPGQYDLGTDQLLMDTEFVDVEGLSEDPGKQYIFGLSSGATTGVIRQTANNVGLENLRVRCTRSSGSAGTDSFSPAAYFPDSNKPATVLRNCKFESNDVNAWAMRAGVIYSGLFEFCTAGIYAFGGGTGGTASGTFNNCTGGDNTFGSGGTASGTFTDCTGGEWAFGGGGGTASGTFTDCTGGERAFGGGGGTASGTFTDCTGGDLAFGGIGTASGTFNNCTGGDSTFGGGGGTADGTFNHCTGGIESFGGFGTADGTFANCTGGDYAFGGGGTASGTFNNCTGGLQAFGGGFGIGTASGTFTQCTGGDHSFGGHNMASGTFDNCKGGQYAFGGGGGVGGNTASGTFNNCTGGLAAFGGGGGLSTASGTFTNCTGGLAAFGGFGTAPNGKFFHCTGGPFSFTENPVGPTSPLQFFCTQNGAQYPFNN